MSEREVLSMFKKFLLASAVLLFGNTVAQADMIASWTFETSIPTTGGPLTPEGGTGSATSNTGGTFSNPVGNGSAESWSSTAWNVGDYYQFTVSTLGFDNIGVSFSQTSSGTGPRDFGLSYAIGAGAYTTFQSYVVLPNQVAAPGVGTWNATTAIPGYSYSFSLSSVTAINDAASVSFRLVNTTTDDANPPGAVLAGGTSRVDDFLV